MTGVEALKKSLYIISNREHAAREEATRFEKLAAEMRSEETAFRSSREVLEDQLKVVESTTQT